MGVLFIEATYLFLRWFFTGRCMKFNFNKECSFQIYSFEFLINPDRNSKELWTIYINSNTIDHFWSFLQIDRQAVNNCRASIDILVDTLLPGCFEDKWEIFTRRMYKDLLSYHVNIEISYHPHATHIGRTSFHQKSVSTSKWLCIAEYHLSTVATEDKHWTVWLKQGDIVF